MMLTRGEKWIYGITFAVLIVFLAMGAVVAYAPTDARTSVFSVMLYVVLGAGIASGLMAVYASNQRRK